VERGDLDFGPVDLAEIAQKCLQSAQATASQSRLSLAKEWPLDLYPVWGDRVRLEQVFINLIGNAIKFSPNGGTITVRLQNVQDRATNHRYVQVDVIDEGIGIASEQLTKIFGRFYQVDGSSTRHFGGTGLGLAIVQDTIQAHGGTIAVNSQLGVGSTFRFTVPAVSDEPEPPGRAREEKNHPRG
jgi:signal transduction histidine kinase